MYILPESAKHSDFQKLWEVLIVQEENFNIEMNLKFNLGPLYLLDNFVKEILVSDSSKST